MVFDTSKAGYLIWIASNAVSVQLHRQTDYRLMVGMSEITNLLEAGFEHN